MALEIASPCPTLASMNQVLRASAGLLFAGALSTADLMAFAHGVVATGARQAGTAQPPYRAAPAKNLSAETRLPAPTTEAAFATAPPAYEPSIAEQVVRQAKKCLTLPGAASRGSFRAEFGVRFEDGVAVQVRVTELEPAGNIGASIVEAAERAIERCGPYPYAGEEGVTLVFESEE